MTPPTITPLLVAELLVEGERWPVYVHVIDHPAARVLVDTGMTELHPEVADLDPRLVPLSEQAFDLAGVDVVVNTHLHFEPLRRQPPLRRTADLRPAAGARGRAHGGRLHDPRVGRGARRALRAGRRRARAAARAPPRPGAGPHARPAGGRRRDGRVRSSSAGTWPFASASSTSRAPRASCGCARSSPGSCGSRTSTSPGGRASCKARRTAYGPR